MDKTDPNARQDMMLVVEACLEQMQDKFQIMYKMIIGRTEDINSHIDIREKCHPPHDPGQSASKT